MTTYLWNIDQTLKERIDLQVIFTQILNDLRLSNEIFETLKKYKIIGTIVFICFNKPNRFDIKYEIIKVYGGVS